VDQFLTRTERGTFTVQAQLTPEVRKTLERLERSTRRLTWTVAAAALLLAGVVLRALDPADPLYAYLLATAALSFLWGWLRGR
jgi:L-asparagine transporter-like permease